MFLDCRHSLLTLAGRSIWRLKSGVSAICPLQSQPRELSAALTAGMALVTINTVEDVALHALMVGSGLSRRVAIRALEDRVIVRIGVARGAHIVGVAVTRRKLRVLRVIKRRTRPGRRVVAVLAGGWEKLRLRGMARVRGVVVVRLMAANAGRRQRGVVIVDVAIGAHPWRHGVRTTQREGRVVVIKGGVCPGRGVMT